MCVLDNPASVSFSTERVDDEKLQLRRNWILIKKKRKQKENVNEYQSKNL